jgi:hypothetical protein
MAKARDPLSPTRVSPDRDDLDVSSAKGPPVREPEREVRPPREPSVDELSRREDPADSLDRVEPLRPVSPPPADAPDTIPEGARVWENRSGEEGSGYTDIQGPDIVYADGTWFAVGDDGTLQPFQEGQYLDFEQVDGPTVEALELESVSGTALFGMGSPQDLGLRLDGESGDFVTQDGVLVDPDALVVVRAADGTTLAYDAEADQWSTLGDLGSPLPPGDVPAGPYTTLGSGDGTPPPLDDLPSGSSLGYDPLTDAYHDPDTGRIVGFHHSRTDDVQSWENRSGDEDAPYDNIQGPDIVYLDEVWYAEQPDGSLVPFHEGRYLDFDEVNGPTVEALEYESIAGTPLWGSGMPSDFDLRLDGETGGFVDAAGNPVDLDNFDPMAGATDTDDFGSGARADAAPETDSFGDGDRTAVDEPDDDELDQPMQREDDEVEAVREPAFELAELDPADQDTRSDRDQSDEPDRFDDDPDL